jgi:hypothetical protein
MEEEEPSIKINIKGSNAPRADERYSGIKISLNTLYHIFGRNSFQIYNYLNKKPCLEISPDTPIIHDSIKLLEDKAKGFYTFVDNFMEKLKKLKNSQKFLKEDKNVDFNLEMKQIEIFPSKSRYLITKQEEIFRLKEEKALLLQKYIRRYIAYVHFLKIFNENIKAQITKCIITIQKNFRRFSINKKFKMYYIKYKILTSLKYSKHKIKNSVESFYIQTLIKKQYLLNNIITIRSEALKLLQNRIKFYLFNKKIKDLLLKEKTHYSISYPFVAHDVKLVIYINIRQHSHSLTYEIKENVYRFEYCKIRNCFVLHIHPDDFKPGKYRVKMIVDNLVTCDGRFPHIEFSDGYYYNIIDFSVKNGKRKYNYPKSIQKAITREDTHESEFKKENVEIISDRSIRDYSNSSSSASFIKELRKNRTNSFDLELKENLENKKAYSYLELIKESVLNDSESNCNNFD